MFLCSAAAGTKYTSTVCEGELSFVERLMILTKFLGFNRETSIET